MSDETLVKARLREWVAAKSGKLAAAELRDDTPLIERRHLTSLQVMELLLFVEELSGRRVRPEQIRPGAFRDIATIYRNFFAGEGRGDGR